MVKNKLHPRIAELKKRSKLINYSAFDVEGSEIEVRKPKAENADTTAYFCIWGKRDTYGTMWVRGCFSKSIKERGPKSSANQKIAICWQHDVRDPIGQALEIVEDEIGAYVGIKWDDAEAVPNAKRAMSQLKSGTINGWSFGFDYVWDKLEYEEATDSVLVREAVLWEISPVTFASIAETFTVRSAEDFEIKHAQLEEETDDFIKQFPKSKQLELRQLISKHITLSKFEPETLEEEEEPKNGELVVAGCKINLNKL